MQLLLLGGSSLNTDNDTFKMMVNQSAEYKARWDAYTDRCIAEAKADGIEVNKSDLAEIPAVRIFVLSGVESGDWKAEAQTRLPEFKKRAELEELRSALDAEETAAATAQAMAETMSPAQRMAQARALDARAPNKQAEAHELTAQERGKLIAENQRLPRSMRLAHARKHGLS